MSRKTFSIGAFEFLNLAGYPVGIQQVTEYTARPGVNDFALWLQGTRGEPFELESVVDVTTHAAGQVLAQLYRDSVGSMAALVFASVSFGTVAILGVPSVECQAIASGVGGLVVNPGAVVRARWRLAVKIGG